MTPTEASMNEDLFPPSLSKVPKTPLKINKSHISWPSSCIMYPRPNDPDHRWPSKSKEFGLYTNIHDHHHSALTEECSLWKHALVFYCILLFRHQPFTRFALTDITPSISPNTETVRGTGGGGSRDFLHWILSRRQSLLRFVLRSCTS